MSVKVTKQEGSKVELKFKISKEAFNEALDKAFSKNAGKFKIPGFRNGKAPRNVIEKTYGEGVMYEEAFNDIAEVEYAKAIEDNKLEVVSHPEVDIKSIGKDKDLEFTIVVYTKPEIKLNAYKGLEIEKIDRTVSEDDVNAELAKVQEKNARILVKEDDSLVENGDITVIDFEGFKDSVAFEGGKAENYELTIGSNTFIPGFEEQLIGMKKGEEKDITVTFPEQYGNTDLAGADAVFKIKLHEIKKKELPELDDEFAKDASEFDTLAEYKEDLKKKLEEKKKTDAEYEKEARAMAKLAEQVEVEIPAPMVEHEIDHMIENFSQNLMYQGFTMDSYIQMLGATMEEIREQFKPNAIKDIKLRLALEEIEKLESPEISDEEAFARIEEIVVHQGGDAEVYKKNPNTVEYIKHQLKHEKIAKIVVDTVVEK